MPATYYDLSSVLSCTYGATSLSLVDCAVKEEAFVKEQMGRLGANVTVTAECRLDLTSGAAGDFASLLATALADLGTDGRDFVVNGLGGAEMYSLLATQCENDAPHISFDMRDGDGPLQKKFTLSIKAFRYNLDGKPFTNNFKIAVTTRPDKLITVEISGEMHGPNNPQYFLSDVLPNFVIAYPWPNWVMDTKYETGGSPNASVLTYSATARQNFGPLPVGANGGVGKAVDGEITTKVDRDEQMRKVTTTTMDLLVTGDPAQILKVVQAMMPKDQPILKQQFAVTTIREQRLTGSFTVLQSADVDQMLMNWSETYRIERAADWYEQKTYPGTGPILVLANGEISKITQSGSAIGAGQFLKEPPPLLNFNAAKPEVSFEDVNTVEKKTTWRYVMWYMGTPQGVSLGGGGSGPGGTLPPTYTPPLGKLARGAGDDNTGYYAQGNLNSVGPYTPGGG